MAFYAFDFLCVAASLRRGVSLMNLLHVPALFIAFVCMSLRRRRVGIRIPQLADDFRFDPFHQFRIVSRFVIEPLQMQHTMHRQMRKMRLQRFSLTARFVSDDRQT